MAPARLARLLTSCLFLAGALGVLGLGGALVSQGAGGDRAAAWLLAWSLVFAALLPTAALVLVAMSLITRREPGHRNVPNAGRTVPGSGQ